MKCTMTTTTTITAASRRSVNRDMRHAFAITGANVRNVPGVAFDRIARRAVNSAVTLLEKGRFIRKTVNGETVRVWVDGIPCTVAENIRRRACEYVSSVYIALIDNPDTTLARAALRAVNADRMRAVRSLRRHVSADAPIMTNDKPQSIGDLLPDMRRADDYDKAITRADADAALIAYMSTHSKAKLDCATIRAYTALVVDGIKPACAERLSGIKRKARDKADLFILASSLYASERFDTKSVFASVDGLLPNTDE